MPESIDVAAAIVRRGNEILMVLQAGPGEEPFWSVPGGRGLELAPQIAHRQRLPRDLREIVSAWLRRMHADGREELIGPL